MLSDITPFAYAEGNGVKTVFDYSFELISDDETSLAVYYTAVGAVPLLLTLSVDYTVNTSLKQVTLTSIVPLASEYISIFRITPESQTWDATGKVYLPLQTFENSLDKLTAIVQENSTGVHRAIKFGEGIYDGTTEVDFVGGIAVGNILMFDANGNLYGTSVDFSSGGATGTLSATGDVIITADSDADGSGTVYINGGANTGISVGPDGTTTVVKNFIVSTGTSTFPIDKVFQISNVLEYDPLAGVSERLQFKKGSTFNHNEDNSQFTIKGNSAVDVGNAYNYDPSTAAHKWNGAVTFNDDSSDYDFIIKKNTSGNAYVYDAGADTHTFNGVTTITDGIAGRTDGAAVTAGNIGEIVTAIPATSTVAGSTTLGNYTDGASITLTAGDWLILVAANGYLDGVSGTGTTAAVYSIVFTDSVDTVLEEVSGLMTNADRGGFTVGSLPTIIYPLNITSGGTYKLRFGPASGGGSPTLTACILNQAGTKITAIRKS